MTYRTDIPGWLHRDEAEALQHICKLAPQGKTVIEVGVYAGRATAVLASECTSSTIYCVDPWWKSDPPFEHTGFAEYTGEPFTSNDAQEIFRKKILSEFSNVVEVHGEFPRDLPAEAHRNVGLIYWDTDSMGDFERMLVELSVAWELLNKGGILAGHTFAHWLPSVVQGVRYFGVKYNVDIILPPSGSMWYAVKS